MRASKICIQLFLLISLVILLFSVPVYAKQEDQIQKQVKKENCPQLQVKSEFSAQKNFISLRVREAAGLVEEKGEEVFPEFRMKGGKWIYDDFYIFVWKINGNKAVRVVYPPDRKGEGQDVTELTDFDGKPIGKLFIEVALSKSGEGWVSYEWPKIGETKLSTKYGFIKRADFEGETYLLGSGFYVED